MRHRPLLVGSILMSAAAGAQDYDAQMHGDAAAAAGQVAVMEAMRDGGGAVPARHRHAGLSASAAATCRNKARAAAKLGRDHPKVRRLYALCARAGR